MNQQSLKNENLTEILIIELGNQPLIKWLKDNRYIIHSELVRFAKTMIDKNLEMVQSVMVMNYTDNIVFLLKKENLDITLNQAMEYFISIEEYELCGEIRDLAILIEKSKNETRYIKNSKQNKRKSKICG